jgi:hypothetical protein
MRRFARAVWPLMLGMVALTLSGCGGRESPKSPAALVAKIGKACEVQFRRNALGAAGQPIPPATGAYNGADVTVGGKLSRVTDDWIVIIGGGREYWIPRENILMLGFPAE